MTALLVILSNQVADMDVPVGTSASATRERASPEVTSSPPPQGLTVGLTATPLTRFVAAVVAGVALCVITYAIGYTSRSGRAQAPQGRGPARRSRVRRRPRAGAGRRRRPCVQLLYRQRRTVEVDAYADLNG
jgi:hypothetical protein